ncbi:MAG: ChrR family anti-sigma-E factor [Oleiphilaceae bacterium]|nr:ChrR family anti-sigma-E factor [Oleiphilaceae bacterium]
MSTHHPDEVMLMEYSAGTLSEPMALCIKLHVDQCSRCRSHLDMLNSLGAVMMENAQAKSQVSDNLFDSIMNRIDQEDGTSVRQTPESPTRRLNPLAKMLGRELDELPWKRQLGDVSVCDISNHFCTGERVTLQKLVAGGRAPSHRHSGTETTLVLHGAFADSNGVFEAGDIVVLDQKHDHRPVALHGEDCYTLSVLTAPVRLTGRFTRLLNPFIR